MTQQLKTIFYIVNAILYLIIIGLWISIPDEVFFVSTVSLATLGLTIALIILDRKRLRNYYLSSQFKNLSNNLVTVFLVFSIVAFLNYFGYKNVFHLDLTQFKKNSLSDQSVKSVKGIDSLVEVKVFAKQNMLPRIKLLMDLYVFSNAHIDVDYIDEEVQPDLVAKYKIEQSGTILIKKENRLKRIIKLDELHITNAFIQIMRKKDPIITFITGHGEADLFNNKNDGYSFLKALLDNSNFEIKFLPLATVSKVPEENNTLVLWGPKDSLTDNEVSLLDQYLEKGGHFLMALNPDLNGDKFENLRKMLQKRGLYILNDLVVDRIKNINGSNGTVPMVNKFLSESPIVKDFKGPLFFPLVSSIQFSSNGSIKGKYQSLAQTGAFPSSWAEQSFKEVVAGKLVFSKGSDIKGPISMASSWESEKSKIVLFGNSTFLTNAYQKYSGNFLFFINSLSWSTGDLELISLNMPILKDEPVFISKPQLGVIFYFSVVFAPLLMFLLAFISYRKRSYL